MHIKSSGKKGRGKSDPIKQRKEFPDLLTKVIEQADILLEVLDARFIDETRNKKVEELIHKKDKVIIYVINKVDIASSSHIEKQLKKAKITPAIRVSSRERKGTKILRDKIKEIAKKRNLENALVGVIGYPNTGKSSVINTLIGKSSAPAAAQSGYTKGIQKLRLSSSITLLDSPGVIPINEYSTTKFSSLAKHTKINVRTFDKVKDPELQVTPLLTEYAKKFEKFYGISYTDPEQFMEEVGKKKNIIKKGKEIDTDKTARLLLKDWQEGNITL